MGGGRETRQLYADTFPLFMVIAVAPYGCCILDQDSVEYACRLAPAGASYFHGSERALIRTTRSQSPNRRAAWNPTTLGMV